MDYEKKYKEALERMRYVVIEPKNENMLQAIKETVFPELKDSEDEKIRKELIAHCRNTRCVTEEGAEQVKNWIAWLEKQGVQKPQRIISAEAKEAMYNKPAWSEEDEVYLNTTIAYLKDAKEFKKTAENCIDWLKKLKQRIGGEP